MSTLKERLDLAVLYAKSRGFITSERNIAQKVVAAGGKMSDGYIGRMRVAMKKNPDGRQDRRILERIADACGVRREWLVLGIPPMEAETEPPNFSKIRKRG